MRESNRRAGAVGLPLDIVIATRQARSGNGDIVMKEHIFGILLFGRGASHDNQAHCHDRNDQTLLQFHIHPPQSWWLSCVLILAIRDLDPDGTPARLN
jgi:hypothetical protein